MNESNYASLTAGLLARKGQAKPAMRPQGYGFSSDEDLGWNDMGSPSMLTPEQRAALLPQQPVAQPIPVPPQMQMVEAPLVDVQADLPAAAAAESAAVPPRFEARALVDAPARPIIAPIPAPRPRAAAGSKAKAAFTLRLDPEQHTRLRLACVYGKQSAQQLLITALDDYLQSRFPDVIRGSAKVA
jgi:hypothetical protein